jgi:23S rRNA pseudouridine2605 synthase
MAERIQKVLANAGLGSRRQIEALIAAGRIAVDGKRAQLGDKITGSERVVVDGYPVSIQRSTHRAPRHYHIAYYKPAGEITSRADPEHRSTVFDAIKPPPRGRWISVGRLDVSTSGLLLLTTDGELAHRLMHPRYEVLREYAVRVLGELSPSQQQQLVDGVELDDGPAALIYVRPDGGSGANRWYRVGVREGRNREIRRIFDAVGVPVSRLIRVGYGPLKLGSMRRGDTRRLAPDEIVALYEEVGLPLDRKP